MQPRGLHHATWIAHLLLILHMITVIRPLHNCPCALWRSYRLALCVPDSPRTGMQQRYCQYVMSLLSVIRDFKS